MKNSRSSNPVSPYCTGCGACVAVSGGALRMDWDDDGFLVPRRDNDAAIPEAAFDACPFLPGKTAASRDEDELAIAFLSGSVRKDPDIGLFNDTYIGYSKAYRNTSSSGGLATYVFRQLLDRGIVDYIFVVTEGSSGYRYRLIGRGDELLDTSKTRYYPVTMSELFPLVAALDGRVAVSGVACFIKAIRLRQAEDPVMRDKIAFLVGIICGGLKSKFFTDYLADSAGAGPDYRKPEYRLKDAQSTSNDYSFSALDPAGREHRMKMSRVGDQWGTGLFKAKACDFCTDVLTELADISLGDAWLPEYRKDGLGNSVIVTRSALADRIVTDGIANGDLEARTCEPSQIIASQKPSFFHRRDALQFRLWQTKLLGRPVPPVRKRVLRSISTPYALVQVQREITRSRSFDIWRTTRSAAAFRQRMRPHLLILKVLTKINHILRRS